MLNKFKKLVTKPKLFIRDSKLIRKMNEPSDNLNIQPVSTNHINAERTGEKDIKLFVKNHLSTHSRVAFIDPKPGKRMIAFTRSNYIEELCCSICSLESNDFELSHITREGLKKGVSQKELYNSFWLKPIQQFRLTNKSNRVERVYFEVQKWTEDEGFIMSPSSNHISRKLWESTIDTHQLFDKGKVNNYSKILGESCETECNFDIDYVFTWVNSEDKNWQSMYKIHSSTEMTDSDNESRFYSRDELKYALRSIELYAPWVRNIFIVSNCQPPSWLKVSDRLQWVNHESIINEEHLPTFNSHAIESCLHKIVGLSNHFIYANDDILLMRPTDKSDFFEPNGNCKIKLEPYGNVNGEVCDSSPDYLNASRNSQRLLASKFSIMPSQLHRHTHQALRVDILNEIESEFKHEFERTRSSKFRTIYDINITSFLFHHYSYYLGRSIKVYPTVLLAKENSKYVEQFNSLLNQKSEVIFNDKSRALTVCINDGTDSHKNEHWNKTIVSFLNTYFKERSVFEVNLNNNVG
ncbi:stealth conserved region 3 domain-containing protein [Shewanella sp. UCD-KL12]|uniref:stealth conserved region 3 domain-containing protein n=1 Tax=Shewanella sp. UCD-KL12 TaxID=1917163 RepID=UPI0009706AEB|nr:stealth conserved region 3 domain-containing protein [Shewanella sp. UCD-KL12]